MSATAHLPCKVSSPLPLPHQPVSSPACIQYLGQTQPHCVLCSPSVGVGGGTGDPALLGAPFVVMVLTVLRIENERPSLTVRHAPVILATTGPEDMDLPGLYWLGPQLAVAALAPCQLSHSGPARAFIKALKTAEQRGVLCLDDRMYATSFLHGQRETKSLRLNTGCK